MFLDQTGNFIKVVVSTGYDDLATSIVLEAGEGAKLPDPVNGEYNLVWWAATSQRDPTDDSNVEIVRVTDKSTDTITVVRAQEDTSASAKNTVDSTYEMILSLTKKMIDDIEDEGRQQTQFADIFSDYVVTSDGLLPATSANLTSDISKGNAYVTGTRVVKAVTSNTYTASVDTYVDISSAGAYTFPEVALGAAAPAVTADSIRLAKVVTDATAITAVIDMRQLDLPVIVNGSEKIRIDKNGNVGIGTTSPGVLLHLDKPDGVTDKKLLYLDNSHASQLSRTIIGYDNAKFSIQSQNIAGSSYSDMLLNPNGGNVGIGTTAPTSRLHSVGSVANSIATKTVGYTATASDYTLLGDATAAAFTITLPAVAACPGRIYNIKKIDSSANTVTIDGGGTETIDGAATKVLSTQWESVTIQNNGTSWFII